MPDGAEVGVKAAGEARAAALAISIPRLRAAQVALALILLAAVITRFGRLATPGEMYFDEIYFVRDSAQLIYHGDPAAFEFYGHENTHPPLSKLFIAGGIAIVGAADEVAPPLVPGEGGLNNSFAWRFFGALAGTGAVLFMYLLARKLFDSEVAGLAAALILTVDGLAFAQSRIATPDTYVLFFMLGCVYFLVSDRFLFSGVFFGAALACKWVAALTVVPIVLYLLWRLITSLRDMAPNERTKWFEIMLPVGLVVLYMGLGLVLLGFLARNPDKNPGLFDGMGVTDYAGYMLLAAGAGSMITGVGGLLYERSLGEGEMLTLQGRFVLEMAIAVGVFFIMVPGFLYLATYIPMLWHEEHRSGFLALGDVVRLNRQAYDFHSTLTAPHPYSSTWDTWPIMGRPVFFHLGGPETKIYSLGNPIVFWLGLPALAFTLWQSLRYVGARIDAGGVLSFWARLSLGQAALLFVVLSYLGFWLPWAVPQETGGRVQFIYHYLPALAFVILALAYTVDWLWRRPEPWARYAVLGFLAAATLTFVYFYPHLAALDVPGWLERTYYWDWLSDLWPSAWLPDWLADWLGFERSPFNWH